MVRTRMLMVAVVSLLLSVVVTLLAYNVLRTRLGSAEETVPVIVAAEKLGLGLRLAEPHLRTLRWPKQAVPEGSFSDPARVIGRGVVMPMAANEVILDYKVSPEEGAGTGLSWAIPEGLRAVAVKVNEVIGVAGFVLPGTRVDVIWSGSADQQNVIDTSKVILENVQVLTAGTNVEQDAKGTPQNVPVVTLLVTPEDAQKLALVGDPSGRVQLALRNPLDLRQINPAAVKKSALFAGHSGGAEMAGPPAVRAARRAAGSANAPSVRALTVELIQGDKRETRTFELKLNQP